MLYYMLFLSLFVVVVQCSNQTTNLTATPKMFLMERFDSEVSSFLTPEQVSKAIDIGALGIHDGHNPDKVLSDIHRWIHRHLDEEQKQNLTDMYKEFSKDLGEKQASVILDRTKKVVVYAVSPGLQKLRVYTTTPDQAYEAMLALFTSPYIAAVKHLIKITLSPNEWNSLKSRFGPIVHFD